MSENHQIRLLRARRFFNLISWFSVNWLSLHVCRFSIYFGICILGFSLNVHSQSMSGYLVDVPSISCGSGAPNVELNVVAQNQLRPAAEHFCNGIPSPCNQNFGGGCRCQCFCNSDQSICQWLQICQQM